MNLTSSFIRIAIENPNRHKDAMVKFWALKVKNLVVSLKKEHKIPTNIYNTFMDHWVIGSRHPDSVTPAAISAWEDLLRKIDPEAEIQSSQGAITMYIRDFEVLISVRSEKIHEVFKRVPSK